MVTVWAGAATRLERTHDTESPCCFLDCALALGRRTASQFPPPRCLGRACSRRALAMYVDCADCPLRQSSAFRPLEGEELEFVRGIKEAQFEQPPRTTIF